jgi:hypothetical protein
MDAQKPKNAWVTCKTINGPDPNKKASWCASLHQQANGKYWCGMAFFGDSCPYHREETKEVEAANKKLI